MRLRNLQFDYKKLKAMRGEIPATEVAAAVGVSKQRLYNYENGIRDPSAAILLRLCVYYDARIQELANVSEDSLERIQLSA